MSNLAKQIQRQQEVQQPKKVYKKQTETKKRRITKGEKYIYCLIAGIIFFCSFKIVSNQAAIYQVNKEIQVISSEVTEQTRMTEDLTASVNELLEYDRVLSTAKKQGLEMNKDNVKVVGE